jgi:SAM-dependent methyltransferase
MRARSSAPALRAPSSTPALRAPSSAPALRAPSSAPALRAFDKTYYDRFYRDRKTRVSSRRDTERLGRFVCAYLDYAGLRVRRVLDAGCGLGYWRRVIARHHPRASYTGIEASEYLCRELGWTHASVAEYKGRGRFDLVVCQGVLQYLDDREAAAALRNLGRLCRGALYLEALTREDWDEHCDKRCTDGRVYLRGANWYRKRLRADFRACGGGLFLHRDAQVVLYSLEVL